MSNKTEEALRREVRDAFFNPTLGLHRSVDILDHPNVRKAFDAYDKAVIAANKPITHRWNIELDGDDLLICDGSHDKGEECKFVRYARVADRPTFEGGEEEVQQRISDVFAGRGDGTYDEAIEVLSLTSALLDAKDAALEKERKAGIQTYKNWMTVSTERDAALSRAEQAEAALAGARGNANKAVDNAAELTLEIVGLRSELAERDAAVVVAMNYLSLNPPSAVMAREKLKPFIPPAKPADPVKEIIAHAEKYDTTSDTDPRRRYTAAQMEIAVRAAIERAGGVKAVFGEGV